MRKLAGEEKDRSMLEDGRGNQRTRYRDALYGQAFFRGPQVTRCFTSTWNPTPTGGHW